MKPAAFEYHVAGSLEEAIALLAEHGWEAKLLAGGQSLIPAMNFRLAQPAVLIDLNRITDLAYIEAADGGGLCIGAMTRQSAVEHAALVKQRAPLVAEAMPWIAHPQIRNRGTFGGSLAHADPAAELPAVALALGAEMHVRGADGRRSIPAEDFFLGLLMTSMEPAEILTEVRLPAPPPRSGVAFEEFARRHGDYALAGAATSVTLAEDGTCSAVSVGLFSVAEGPVIAPGARSLVGSRPDPDAIEATATAVAQELDPPADLHASAAYRRHLARVLVRRTLTRASARAARTLA